MADADGMAAPRGAGYEQHGEDTHMLARLLFNVAHGSDGAAAATNGAPLASAAENGHESGHAAAPESEAAPALTEETTVRRRPVRVIKRPRGYDESDHDDSSNNSEDDGRSRGRSLGDGMGSSSRRNHYSPAATAAPFSPADAEPPNTLEADWAAMADSSETVVVSSGKMRTVSRGGRTGGGSTKQTGGGGGGSSGGGGRGRGGRGERGRGRGGRTERTDSPRAGAGAGAGAASSGGVEPRDVVSQVLTVGRGGRGSRGGRRPPVAAARAAVMTAAAWPTTWPTPPSANSFGGGGGGGAGAGAGPGGRGGGHGYDEDEDELDDGELYNGDVGASADAYHDDQVIEDDDDEEDEEEHGDDLRNFYGGGHALSAGSGRNTSNFGAGGAGHCNDDDDNNNDDNDDDEGNRDDDHRDHGGRNDAAASTLVVGSGRRGGKKARGRRGGSSGGGRGHGGDGRFVLEDSNAPAFGRGDYGRDGEHDDADASSSALYGEYGAGAPPAPSGSASTSAPGKAAKTRTWANTKARGADPAATLIAHSLFRRPRHPAETMEGTLAGVVMESPYCQFRPRTDFPHPYDHCRFIAESILADANLLVDEVNRMVTDLNKFESELVEQYEGPIRQARRPEEVAKLSLFRSRQRIALYLHTEVKPVVDEVFRTVRLHADENGVRRVQQCEHRMENLIRLSRARHIVCQHSSVQRTERLVRKLPPGGSFSPDLMAANASAVADANRYVDPNRTVSPGFPQQMLAPILPPLPTALASAASSAAAQRMMAALPVLGTYPSSSSSAAAAAAASASAAYSTYAVVGKGKVVATPAPDPRRVRATGGQPPRSTLDFPTAQQVGDAFL